MKTRLLNEAIDFATEKHNGQFRKGTSRPYITHPLEVVQILEGMGADETLLIAGVLHDTLEDTDTTKEEIKERFGQAVVDLVCGHTEDKSQSWQERKENAIREVESANLQMKMLVLADKLSNISDMWRDHVEVGEHLWERFHAPKERQAWYYQSMRKALTPVKNLPQAKKAYQEFERLVLEVFR